MDRLQKEVINEFRFPSMRNLYEKSAQRDKNRQHPSFSKDFEGQVGTSYDLQISYAGSNQYTERRASSKLLHSKAKRQERLQTSEGDDISSICNLTNHSRIVSTNFLGQYQANQASKSKKMHQRSKDSRIPQRKASPMFQHEVAPKRQSRLQFNRLADLQLDLPRYDTPNLRQS